MSDTLQEREDEIPASAHKVNSSGNCSISGCPCRGWSARETAGAIAFVDGTLRDTKDTSQLATTHEHQPAARGGGDDSDKWNLLQDQYTYEWVIRPEWNADGRVPFVISVTGERAKEAATQILAEHNQHQSLVAERGELRRVMRIIRDSYWSENEPYSDRVEYLQGMAKAALQQRSTSE